MKNVRCGCGVIVMEIDDGKPGVEDVGGAECPPCYANGGSYDKSPHWKENLPSEGSDSGKVLTFPSPGSLTKAERKALRRRAVAQ